MAAIAYFNFTGWTEQSETIKYYKKADIFCFPSVREFGGAVVLEAMASGLPCIIVDNGGIGEYVTEGIGFKIKPISREHVIGELAEKISILINNKELRRKMSDNAVKKAEEFEWGRKADKILDVYEEILKAKHAESR